MATITCHDARQHEESCDLCGQAERPVVQIQAELHNDIWICEICIHTMYVKCCAAFNVRPAKLW